MPRVKSDNICIFEQLIHSGWKYTNRTKKCEDGAAAIELEKSGEKMLFPVEKDEKLKAMAILAEQTRRKAVSY